MAEWLRRLTRNQFPSGSAGSNPADCELIFDEIDFIDLLVKNWKLVYPGKNTVLGQKIEKELRILRIIFSYF